MTMFERLVAAVAAPRPADCLDGDMGWSTEEGKPAAVLIAVSDAVDPSVLLTVRQPDMRTHAGQVAFPGGRLDPGEDAIAAALREAEEEVGLAVDKVRVAGTLDPYRTITGYDVTPVLALVPPGLPLVPREAEVADAFEVPLAHLLDRANHARKSLLFQGTERHYYEIMWEERRIWGATAAMIVNLSRRLQWP